MAVSLAIAGIFSVKQWPDLEIWVWGSPSPSSLNQMLQLTHQWPVYQLRIIRCSTIIAFGVYRVKGTICIGVSDYKLWVDTTSASAVKALPSPAKAGALRDGDVLLFVCSFVCRLKRVLVGHWLTGPAVLAAAQRSRANRTAGVPDIFSSMKNFTAVKFTLAAGAYSWSPIVLHFTPVIRVITVTPVQCKLMQVKVKALKGYSFRRGRVW